MTTDSGPGAVTLRSARLDEPTEVLAIADVVTTAFGDHGAEVSALVGSLRAGGHGRAEVVAVAGGTSVVGHVMLTRGWVDARERLVEVLVLSPLAVSPDWQRGGLGTALVTAAVDVARTFGAPALFLEGDPDYYGARGFEPGERHGFERPSDRIPGPAFQVVPLALEPWMTGRLVYPDPFWAHDSVGLRGERLAAVETALAQREGERPSD